MVYARILDESVSILHSSNIIEKDYNPTLLSPAMDE